MSYSLQAGSGRNYFRPDPAHKLSANLYDIPLLCVQWKTSDDGQRNCPKHVEFYSKNKFEKLERLVGFIIGTLYLTVSVKIYIKEMRFFLLYSFFWAIPRRL
jgi:hypothetical protein